jgi:hypothetical protein
MGKLATLVVLGWLVAAVPARAQTATGAPIYGQNRCCERWQYPIANYWLPFTYRWRAWCRGPCRYTFARNFHPDIPVSFHPIPYRCRSVDPLIYSLDHYYPGVRMPYEPPPGEAGNTAGPEPAQ